MVLRWIAVIVGVLLFATIIFTIAAPPTKPSERQVCDDPYSSPDCLQIKIREERWERLIEAREALEE